MPLLFLFHIILVPVVKNPTAVVFVQQGGPGGYMEQSMQPMQPMQQPAMGMYPPPLNVGMVPAPAPSTPYSPMPYPPAPNTASYPSAPYTDADPDQKGKGFDRV